MALTQQPTQPSPKNFSPKTINRKVENFRLSSFVTYGFCCCCWCLFLEPICKAPPMLCVRVVSRYCSGCLSRVSFGTTHNFFCSPRLTTRLMMPKATTEMKIWCCWSSSMLSLFIPGVEALKILPEASGRRHRCQTFPAWHFEKIEKFSHRHMNYSCFIARSMGSATQ